MLFFSEYRDSFGNSSKTIIASLIKQCFISYQLVDQLIRSIQFNSSGQALDEAV